MGLPHPVSYRQINCKVAYFQSNHKRYNPTPSPSSVGAIFDWGNKASNQRNERLRFKPVRKASFLDVLASKLQTE